ncbi:MAG: PKD domain-containing protein, partial [Nitrospira sp.]
MFIRACSLLLPLDGICLSHPVVFTDQSTSVYGTITARQWNFGDFAFDYSNAVTVNHIYGTIGKKKIQLIITDSKGCRDIADKEITIVTQPPIQLAFRDTLICMGDQLSLAASGNGTVNWTPLIAITNANTFNPTVSPPVTTTYYVHLDAGDCANDDSVRVKVTDHVSLTTMPDTVICSGDIIRLRATADALHFSWTQATQLNNAALLSPDAITTASTTYRITATTGGCSATGTIHITTISYPYAKTGPDKTICEAGSVQLQGTVNGSTYSWSPPESLNDPFALNPIASPVVTTSYVLSVFDTLGCPKPGRDTTQIIVSLPVKASAVHDTIAVTGQPLQLYATGGDHYLWTPSTGLSDATIANPVALYHSPSQNIHYSVYVFNEAACRDSVFVNIKVYNTAPVVFVPSAFTPNSD